MVKLRSNEVEMLRKALRPDGEHQSRNRQIVHKIVKMRHDFGRSDRAAGDEGGRWGTMGDAGDERGRSVRNVTVGM